VTRFLPLVWRNLGRHKLRNVLTGCAISLAVALVCLLRTIPAGLDAFIANMTTDDRISTHNKAGVVYDLPYAYLEKVRALPGVVGATSWTWFGGVVELEQGVAFPTFAVDPESIGSVYPDLGIATDALAAFQSRRDAALVGRQTLHERGWRVGDRVTLMSGVFPVELDFQIVGEIPSEQDSRFWFQREYLVRALEARGISFDQLGMIWARVDDPNRVGSTISAIDGLFRNSEAETTSESERIFFGNLFDIFSSFLTIVLLVTTLVASCVVLIAANTASLSVRERTVEIAVLKTLGFRRRLLFGTLVFETLLLSTISGSFGVLLAWCLTSAARRSAASDPSFGPLRAFVVTDAIFLQGLLLALAIGVLAAIVPAWSVTRRSVATTLHEVL
jgi:putative ABC transport system permease protein